MYSNNRRDVVRSGAIKLDAILVGVRSLIVKGNFKKNNIAKNKQ